MPAPEVPSKQCATRHNHMIINELTEYSGVDAGPEAREGVAYLKQPCGGVAVFYKNTIYYQLIEH